MEIMLTMEDYEAEMQELWARHNDQVESISYGTAGISFEEAVQQMQIAEAKIKEKYKSVLEGNESAKEVDLEADTGGY